MKRNIFKRFLCLFLCFSLLTGTYTKKANAIALVDDAFYVVAGVVVTGATIYALVDYTLSTGTSSYSADDVDKISTSLTNTQKLSTYLSVKAVEGGAKFLTWSKNGLDWLSNCINSYNAPAKEYPGTVLGTNFDIWDYKYPNIIGYNSYMYKGGWATFEVTFESGKVGRFSTPNIEKSGNYTLGLTYSPSRYPACGYNGGYFTYTSDRFSIYDKIVSFSLVTHFQGNPVEEEKINVKDYAADNVNYNFFNPQPDQDDNYKPKIGFPLREFDKNSKPDYEPQINPDTGEEYEPFETPYTGDDAKENPDILVIPNPTPDPDPNPTPDPDPNPDEDTIPDLDFGPLFIGIKDKFPFCIPFDIVDFINSWNVDREAPRIKVVFPEKLFVGGGEFEFSFDLFEELIIFLRYMELLAFYYFMMKKSRALIGAGGGA